MSTLEEPKAFIVWNRQLAGTDAAATATASSNATSCSISSSDYSCSLSDSQILSMWDPAADDSQPELVCSELKPKEPLYNIIRSKMNLADKRGPKFVCQECRHPIHTRLSMITHMKMHLQPFCEVCFTVLESQAAVHSHILNAHPEVVSRENTDFYSLQTIAPPNTPTLMSDDEMKAIEELTNPIIRYPMSLAVMTPATMKEETDGELTTEDEARLVIDDGPRPGPSRGRPPKKEQPIVKRALKKKKPKKTKVEDTLPDNVMKKITSRFGRSISLKVPQF